MAIYLVPESATRRSRCRPAEAAQDSPPLVASAELQRDRLPAGDPGGCSALDAWQNTLMAGINALLVKRTRLAGIGGPRLPCASPAEAEAASEMSA